MVELGEVSQDGETVGGVAAGHISRVKKGWDAKLLFGESEDELAVPLNVSWVKAVKRDEIRTKPMNDGTKSESIFPSR